MKKQLLTSVILLTSFLHFFGQAAPKCIEPLKNGDKVLFIGNSFTGWSGPLPDVIQSIIAASGSGLNVEFTFLSKGMGILKEYATWSSLGMVAEIQKGGWKYVVIQGWRDAIDTKDSQTREDGTTNDDYIGWPECQDTMLKYFKILDAEVKKVGATTILYQPHVGKSNFIRDYSRSHNTYNKLRNEVSCFFAPVLNSWDSIRVYYPATDTSCQDFTIGSFADFLYGDCGHQNTNGMMLDAVTFYTILTGRSASTLNPLFIKKMTRPDLYEEFARIGYNVGKYARQLNGCSITDTEAPTKPTNLSASNLMPDFFNLNWTVSTDNVGVLGYEVYQDNVLLGLTSVAKYAVGNLSPQTEYKFKVRAFDSEGNKSAFSNEFIITTPALTSVDTTGLLMAWEFTGQEGKQSMATTDFMTGISGTAPSAVVAGGPGLLAKVFRTNGLSMGQQDKMTLAEAITAEDYYTFTVAPLSGNEISIDSIFIRPFEQNGRNRRFTLMSSVKGFMLGDVIDSVICTKMDNAILQKYTLTGHNNISSPIEFRVYVHGYTKPTEGIGIGNGDGGFTNKDILVYGKIKSTTLPLFPTNLTASNISSSGFTLNWRAAKDAVSYEVFKNGVSQGTTTSLSKNITGVSIGNTYVMTVKAYNGSSWSDESLPLNVTIPDLIAPTVPQNLKVFGITHNSFTLRWNQSTDNVGVVLYEITMNGQPSGNTSDTTLPLPYLDANTSYSMAVRAKDAYGNVSAYCSPLVVTTLKAPDSQAPTAPKALTSTAKTHQSVTLSWTGSTDNVAVTYYLIFRDGIKIDSTKLTSLSVSGLSPSTLYTFTVKARDEAGNVSAASNSLAVTTSASPDTEAPSAPTNLSTSMIESTSVTLSWTASTDNIGVTSYEVFKDGISAGTSTTTTMIISGLSPNPTYQITVKAKDAAGNISKASSVITVTTATTGFKWSLSDISVYPNPFRELLSVDNNMDEIYSIMIFNNEGNVLLQYSNLKGNILLNTVSISKGLYYIRITSTKGSLVKKIVCE